MTKIGKCQYKNILKISRKTICVDIDGVLTQETKGPFLKRTPNLYNIFLVNALFLNNKIKLFTSRYKRDGIITKKWLKVNRVKYHELILGKPRYDIFIDDKAFNSFSEVIVK